VLAVQRDHLGGPLETRPLRHLLVKQRFRDRRLSKGSDLRWRVGSILDGIHPTSAANGRVVKALLELMEAKGIRR
jgi:hypothetical protein